MEITVQIGVIVALVLALASIAGGGVLFLGSRRVGWRALGMSAVAGGVGVLVVFASLLLVSSEGQAPEPVIVGKVVSTQATDAPTTSQEPRPPTLSGMMVPRAGSAEELVSRSHVIVLGTIGPDPEERQIGPYGEDGKPLPADDEGGLPFTDYLVRIEDMLKADDSIADSDTLVLRMFGHLSDRGAVITPNLFTLPNPGDRLLFALGRNPDGTYGSGPEGLLDIDGETVAFADGIPFAVQVSPDQLIQAIKDTPTNSVARSKQEMDDAGVIVQLAERASDTPGGSTVALQAHNEPDAEADVVHQDASIIPAPDLALTAKQTGLPVESVERAIAFQEAFWKYAGELIIRFPDQISAVWVDPVPNTRGHVRFTGEVPPEVTSEIERQGLLDPNHVVLTGGGMISMADHSRRAELAHEALVELGYRNFTTFFDSINNVIRIKLQLPEGASQPSKLDLVGPVQDRVRAERDQSGEARFQGRAATVDALDLELIVITGSGPIVTLDHGRGGV